MDEVDKANFLIGCDSVSEAEDKEFFKKEYTTMSLEAKFEAGLIDEETYDAQIELRRLKENGNILC